MSRLEALPTELLEHIFLCGLNLDLPRASPVIAAKLSREPLYIKTLIAVFGGTWMLNYGLRPIDGPVYISEAAERRAGDRVLQSSILQCRWATLSILLKSQEIWFKRFAPYASYMSDSSPSRIGSEDTEHFTIEADFNKAFDAMSYLIEHDPSDITTLANSWKRYADVVRGTLIPTSLLLGPWDDETTRHLFWLVKGGAGYEAFAYTSVGAGLDGLKAAIRIGDLRVIYLLVWAGLNSLSIMSHEAAGSFIFCWALRNAGGERVKVISLLVKFGLVPFDHHEVQMVLFELEAEAETEHDEPKMAYVQAVKDLRIFE